jgi:hypothetical protein
MSKIQVGAWKCDLCGHVWIAGKVYPKQCAKCRTRIWNSDGAEPKAAEPVEVSRGSSVVVAESRVSIAEDFTPCTYTEYDQDQGEQFGCRLELGHRSKHARGPKL